MRFAEFRSWCSDWWAGIFFQSRISRPGEGGNTTDTVRVTDPTADSPEEVIQGTRLEQYGDIVCPPKDCNSISLTKRDGGIVIPLGDPAVRPTDEKSGDRGLYCDVAGTRIHLYGSQQGAKAGDVVVNDGTSPVVRISDGVNCGSFVAVVAGSPPVVAVTMSYVDPGGNTIPWFAFTATAGTPGTYSIAISGVSHPGAPHFKA